MKKDFLVSFLVFTGLIFYLLLTFWGFNKAAIVVSLITIGLGSYGLLAEFFVKIKEKQFGLDYIAVLAIIASLIAREYLVGIILALMISGGRNLEKYAGNKAKQSLTQLVNRIPTNVQAEEDGQWRTIPITKVVAGQTIIVRQGEVVPLDGALLSENAVLDESSLTGEAYPVDIAKGAAVHSGTINLKASFSMKVTKEEKDSSYSKIIALVKKAQKEKAPIIRLADRYSLLFTIITLVISGITFYFSSSFDLVLAVLVVATPCPLILATPIALIGGMNRAAKNRMIVKKLSSLEVLARVNALIFDKTGTITIGKPIITNVIFHDKNEKEILGIASAIERNSLHPLAKAIVDYGRNKKTPLLKAENIKEEIGKGISGIVKGRKYSLRRSGGNGLSMSIGLFAGNKSIAVFYFEDVIKKESKNTFLELNKHGMELFIFTGDKKETARKVVEKLGIPVSLKADCKPEDKKRGIEEIQKHGKITAMVGDGINDAPALACSDVGIVVSNDEQTSATDAADIVLLGGDFSLVLNVLQTAKRTVSIAKQSIVWGIGMSAVSMVLASFGLIPPLSGAILQEAIDVAVILNALRASR